MAKKQNKIDAHIKADEMTQWVRELLHKHEKPSLGSDIHMKSLPWVHVHLYQKDHSDLFEASLVLGSVSNPISRE